MQKFIHASLIIVAFCLAACSSSGATHIDKDEEKLYSGKTAADIYRSAEIALSKEEFRQAAADYQALETLYPGNPYSEQAALDKVYALYKDGNGTQALSAADDFMHRFPNSKKLAYAYYLKGLINFRPDRGVLGQYVRLNETARDNGQQESAYRDLLTVVERFPTSPYAKDARQRLVYLRNIFAERELMVARFYLQQGAYVAAANRANEIILHYEKTKTTEMALAVLVKAYQHLGLPDKADETLALLQKNYPHSKALIYVEKKV